MPRRLGMGRDGAAGEQPRLQPGAAPGFRSSRARCSTSPGRSWKGKIAVAPTDSDFPPRRRRGGRDLRREAAAGWLAGLKRNAQTYQDEEAVVAAVNRGDVAAGIVNQYYWYRLRLEVGSGAMHSTLYYFPSHDPGSITNISGAAVLASSGHRADAERFVAFLVEQARAADHRPQRRLRVPRAPGRRSQRRCRDSPRSPTTALRAVARRRSARGAADPAGRPHLIPSASGEGGGFAPRGTSAVNATT